MSLDEAARRLELRDLLMSSRARLKPHDMGLPSHVRRRVGGLRREDVAQLVGVSTRWYELFEAGNSKKRFSHKFVRRVADALRLDENERARLFRLALPEVSEAMGPPGLRPFELTERSELLLEAFGSLRRLVGKLWSANTEIEALTLVREHAATQLNPGAMHTLARSSEGLWDRVTTGNVELAKRYDSLAQGSSGGPFIDALCCYGVMAQPGELITRSQRDARYPSLAARERQILDAIGLPDLSFAMANIRSKRGLTARLVAIHLSSHAFTDLELAHVSTLAELASLALSGYVSSPRE
jgi:transcriptional regulator with XRE-family HTH domain